MYFQEASTEDLLTVRGTMTAETMVVASMAIHITPTLLAVTATSMVKAKSEAKTRKRRICTGV